MDLEKFESLRSPRITFVSEFSLADAGIRVDESIRSYCEQNLCGMCGKNWACPPYVPSVEICRNIVASYGGMILIRTTFPRTSLFDLEEMDAASEEHHSVVKAIRKEFREKCEGKTLILSAGGCRNCRECSCPKEPCRDPKNKMNSIESYAIDLDSFLIKNRIPRRGGSDEQSFFAMVLFRLSKRGRWSEPESSGMKRKNRWAKVPAKIGRRLWHHCWIADEGHSSTQVPQSTHLD